MTTRQAVSGVDRTRPMGPQSQVQKVAATSTATGDRPALAPKSQGSRAWLVTSSTTMKRPKVSKKADQPGAIASESASGKSAASQVPIYGTNRSTRNITPQSAAFGTPIKKVPSDITAPYIALRTSS